MLIHFQAVISLLNDKDVSMRLDAIFILGYITDEKEAEKLKDNSMINSAYRDIRVQEYYHWQHLIIY